MLGAQMSSIALKWPPCLPTQMAMPNRICESTVRLQYVQRLCCAIIWTYFACFPKSVRLLRSECSFQSVSLASALWKPVFLVFAVSWEIRAVLPTFLRCELPSNPFMLSFKAVIYLWVPHIRWHVWIAVSCDSAFKESPTAVLTVSYTEWCCI